MDMQKPGHWGRFLFRSRMKGDKLGKKISYFMETLTSRLIHDISVNECVLEFVKQLKQVTDNRYLHLCFFHNKVHFFSSGDNFFHIFFLTVNISTLRQFLEPSHLNFFHI